MKVALVLGAGGRVGAAYLAGALTALEIDLGFDARTADLIVGTSAGSLVGAVLRAGVPASDLAAWTVGARCSPAGAVLPEPGNVTEFPSVSVRDFIRPLRPPSVSFFARAVRAPWQFDALRAYALHLPAGRHELRPELTWLDAAFGDAWPCAETWLVAAGARSGRRSVLGRDRYDVPVSASVAASCAVPGYFSPVSTGDDHERLVDGGIVSTTNADLLTSAEPPIDLAIVIAPMSTAGGAGTDLVGLMRRRVRRQLDRELRVVAAHGIDVLRIEPGRDVSRLAGFDFMAEDNAVDIVRAAVLETGAALRSNPLLARVDRRHAAA
jgi:NTE family protein